MARTAHFNRAHILATVSDLFWDKGYQGTSIQDLVAATGLNRSSLYNSFGSKMELYKTVLIQYQDDRQVVFQNSLMRAENPLQALHLVFENFVEIIIKDERGRGCFNLNCKVELSRSNAPIRDYLEKMEASEIDFFRGLVQEGQDAQFVNKRQDATHYAHFLCGALQGLRMTGILIRKRAVLEQIASSTLSVLH